MKYGSGHQWSNSKQDCERVSSTSTTTNKDDECKKTYPGADVKWSNIKNDCVCYNEDLMIFPESNYTNGKYQCLTKDQMCSKFLDVNSYFNNGKCVCKAGYTPEYLEEGNITTLNKCVKNNQGNNQGNNERNLEDSAFKPLLLLFTLLLMLI